MPGLSDLLDEAVGPVEPSFDVDDVTTRGTRAPRPAAPPADHGRGRDRGRRRRGGGLDHGHTHRRLPGTDDDAESHRRENGSAVTRDAGAASHHARGVGDVPRRCPPRPLLLVSENPIGASVTFDNQTKDAFDSGAFEQPTSFPDAPTQVDGRPIIGAADALADLRAQATPVAGPHPTPVPLKIATMRLDRAGFGTDRGVVSLPAWIFTFDGVQGAVPVLALAPAARFPTPRDLVQAPPSLSAQLAPDGSTVTVSFTGAAAGSGPCTADYTVDARARHRAAVAVSIQEHRNGTGAELCDLVGHARTATVTLARPLGGRVLVDAATKQAITVQP